MTLAAVCATYAQGNNRLEQLQGEEGRRLNFRFREAASQLWPLLREDSLLRNCSDWRVLSKIANLLPVQSASYALSGEPLAKALELKAVVNEILAVTTESHHVI